MNRYGSRKFIVAIYAQSSALYSLVYGLIDGAQFVSITAAVLLLYGSANVAQKFLEERK
jgi:hypothetical protein